MRKILLFCIIFGILILTALPAQAAAITVDVTCSLVNAISSANTDSSVGGCTAGAGADTITLTGNVSLTAVDNSTQGDSGLPEITSNITIIGNGFTISRAAGSPAFRIFAVSTAGNLTLRYVTVSGGLATAGATICHATLSCGGGIFNQGTTTVEYSVIDSNEGEVGGGIQTNQTGSVLTIINSTISNNLSPIDGAGLYVFRSPNVTITGSQFLNNTTSFHSSGRDPNGAAIYDHQGKIDITSSLFEGNQVANTGADAFAGRPNVGGAMYITGGEVNIDSSIFRNNVGRRAVGAIFIECCLAATPAGVTPGLHITNSQFISNRSTLTGNAGAIFTSGTAVMTIDRSLFLNNTAIANGGAIFQRGTSATLTNSTISGNSSVDGGGIFVEAGTMTISYSTIADNTGSGIGDGVRRNGGVLSINNSIIRNASAGANCSGTITDGGNNLANDASCGTITNSATINLDTLQDNGGFGDTYALLAGSSALNSGNNTTCSTATVNSIDQRGMPRDDGNCDIGAYEANYVLPTVGFLIAGRTIMESQTGTVRLLVDNTTGTLPAGTSITVYLHISLGTALDSVDYNTTAIPVTLTVPAPGTQSTTSFDVSAILDGITEGSETVTFTIFAIVGPAQAGAIQAHTVTIQDFMTPTRMPTSTHTPEAQVAGANPSITKLGFLRDGQIEWVITVTNNSNQLMSNLVVSDILPANLVSLNLPAGVSSQMNGQSLSLTIGQLLTGQSISMSVFTAASDGGFSNTACIQDYELCATGLVVSQLPTTGEPLWWMSLLPLLGIGVIGAAIVGRREKA